VIAALVALLAVGLTAFRARFGVDFTDEAFYVALPYRFALGDVPFVDELHIIQTSGILLRPLVEVFLRINGGTEGIVLFMRLCHLVMVVGVGAAVFALLRKLIPTAHALLAASVFVGFVPYSLPSPSYNTMTSAALVLGTVSLLWHFVVGGPRWVLALAGLFFGLAVVLYPPGMVLPAVAGLLVVLRHQESGPDRVRGALWYAFGALVAAQILIVPAFNAGMDAVLRSLEYTGSVGSAAGGSLLARLADGMRSARDLLLQAPLFLLIYAIMYRAYRMGSRWWSILLPAAVVVAVLEVGFAVRSASAFMGLVLGVLAPIVWAMLRSGDFAVPRRVFVIAFPVSFTGGLAFALTSTNKAGSFGLGFWPMMIPVAVGLSALVARTPNEMGGTRRGRFSLSSAGFVLGLALLVSAGVLFQYGSVYRDEPIVSLVRPVVSGPYAGLMTTAETADLLVALERDIVDLAGENGRVLSFDRFPAGFLFTGGPPASSTVWIGMVDRDVSHRQVKDYLNRTGALPDAVLVNHGIRNTLPANGPSPGGPLLEFLEQEMAYSPALVRDSYFVYTRH